MDRKKFAIYAALVCAAMGAVVGYGVSKRNALLPAIAFIIGTVLIALGKRGVKEVIEDERTHRISEKVSRKIYQIFVTGAALIGTTLIALNKHIEVGYTLAFSACALLVLYLVLYSYYSRRAL
ncbi:MAG: DUF2178 domain-containing protein [Thermoplasmata archaeon]|nr:MAG: DUF2178 domain-containing protein [Thermoplasmata archaeon]